MSWSSSPARVLRTGVILVVGCAAVVFAGQGESSAKSRRKRIDAKPRTAALVASDEDRDKNDSDPATEEIHRRSTCRGVSCFRRPAWASSSPLAGFFAPRQRGDFRWRSTNVLLHDLEIAISSDTTVGGKIILPIMLVGVVPSVAHVLERTGNWTSGITASAGVVWPYADLGPLASMFSGKMVLAGGGPQSTYRGGRLALSAGIPIYGVRLGHVESQTRIEGMSPKIYSRTYFENYLVVMPFAAADVTIGADLAVHLEAHMPLGPNQERAMLLLSYGVEYRHRSAAMGLGFLRVQHPSAEALQSSLPLGIPMVTASMTN